MGIDQCGTGGGKRKPAWALRSAWYSRLVLGGRASNRSRRPPRPRLLMGVVDVLDGFRRVRRRQSLSAPSSTMRPSSFDRDLLGFLHFPGAFRSAPLRSGRPAAPGPLTGKTGALRRKLAGLAARRGMSRPLRSVIDTPRCPNTKPAPALMTMAMPAITAKAAKRLPPDAPLRTPENQGPGNLPTVFS